VFEYSVGRNNYLKLRWKLLSAFRRVIVFHLPTRCKPLCSGEIYRHADTFRQDGDSDEVVLMWYGYWAVKGGLQEGCRGV